MKKEEKFFTLLKQGKVKPDDMDDYIDAWHKGNGFGMDLWDYLGMTFQQYKLFVENQFKPMDRFYGVEKNKKVASKKIK